MTLHIECYLGKRFAIFSFTPVFSVDLNTSVKEKLNDGEQLTNATALKILEQIKFNSRPSSNRFNGERNRSRIYFMHKSDTFH